MNFVGSPDDEEYESFALYESDGFSIYVGPGIQAEKETVTIGLQKAPFEDRPSLDGINRFPDSK